ncbi:MAG: hypothetical protein ACK4GW_16645 [Pseudorhodobacter sp.]
MDHGFPDACGAGGTARTARLIRMAWLAAVFAGGGRLTNDSDARDRKPLLALATAMR